MGGSAVGDVPECSPVADQALTRAERQLRGFVAFIGLVSAAFIVMYLVAAATYGSRYPFVANSLAKDALVRCSRRDRGR